MGEGGVRTLPTSFDRALHALEISPVTSSSVTSLPLVPAVAAADAAPQRAAAAPLRPSPPRAAPGGSGAWASPAALTLGPLGPEPGGAWETRGGGQAGARELEALRRSAQLLSTAAAAAAVAAGEAAKGEHQPLADGQAASAAPAPSPPRKQTPAWGASPFAASLVPSVPPPLQLPADTQQQQQQQLGAVASPVCRSPGSAAAFSTAGWPAAASADATQPAASSPTQRASCRSPSLLSPSRRATDAAVRALLQRRAQGPALPAMLVEAQRHLQCAFDMLPADPLSGGWVGGPAGRRAGG